MKVLDTRVLIKIEKGSGPVTKVGALEFKTGQEFDKAEVISVGNKVEGLNAGDKVLVYPGAGKQITVDGESFTVISSSEIIVIL